MGSGRLRLEELGLKPELLGHPLGVAASAAPHEVTLAKAEHVRWIWRRWRWHGGGRRRRIRRWRTRS